MLSCESASLVKVESALLKAFAKLISKCIIIIIVIIAIILIIIIIIVTIIKKHLNTHSVRRTVSDEHFPSTRVLPRNHGG